MRLGSVLLVVCDAQTEIFAHIYESYYCMPLPDYAFEWGPAKGAKIPTDANIVSLAKGLADIAKQRAPWFKTPNVLIPWGCDYQYQNAALVYNSTDWLIDVINAHPEWGALLPHTEPACSPSLQPVFSLAARVL